MKIKLFSHARTHDEGNNFLNTREWFALSTAASIHVLPSTSTIDAFSTANYVSVCPKKGIGILLWCDVFNESKHQLSNAF